MYCIIRTWNTLCEKLQEDKITKEKRREAKKNGETGRNAVRRSVDLKSSADMLRGASGAKQKKVETRPSATKAAAEGLSKGWKALKNKGTAMGILSSRSDKSKNTASVSVEQVTEFPMWDKTAAQDEDITEEYLAGRDLAGQAFVEVFSRLNPWAVRDFDYGLSADHAGKMGLALELIVSGATKPLSLQQRLRVLALGHVQMGIKPEMFPSFEKALFEFLNEVPFPHCRRLRHFPYPLHPVPSSRTTIIRRVHQAKQFGSRGSVSSAYQHGGCLCCCLHQL